MAFDMVKFERGQVWVIRWKNYKSAGHEQNKDRPWLILSAGKFQTVSGMITAVPITTRDEVRTPAQVKIVNSSGRDNVILCEQIRSFDTNSGEYMFDYMGVASPDILEKVDVALSFHLGMHYSPITLKNLYDTMEAIIKSVGYMQQKDDTPKFSEEDVIKFTEKLKEHSGLSSSEASDNAPKVDAWGVPLSGDDVVSEDAVQDTPKEEVSTKEVKSTRIKWTPKICKEFLHDSETLPMKEVMKKWNISKKTRYYSMRNYAQDLMKKLS